MTIAAVNSEVGICQDIKAISKVLKDYPNVYFHSDMTQAIGKLKVDLSYVDFASFSGQKFYGMKGIGCLIKKKNITLVLSHVNEQPIRVMEKAGFVEKVGRENFCAHIDDALKRAEAL